jgi:iron complex outermembrane receptor protein
MERGLATWALAGLLACVSTLEAASDAEGDEFLELSIEELMEVEIYTASKRQERVFDSPSASYVIREEEIAAMGVAHPAEALRLAPGVHVARLSADRWAISIRGFNSVFANKLLTAIDGRTIYSPAFSGTFWEEQDLLLDNIEHIEVVRGPGGALWGANAVNGVINIITKPASETQGAYAKARVGSQEMTYAARYGGRIGERELYYRAWFKHADYEDQENPLGPNWDNWNSTRGGLRLDWETDAARSFTLEGGGFYQESDRLYLLNSTGMVVSGVDEERRGGYLRGQWRIDRGENQHSEIRSYVNANERHLDDRGTLREYRFDVAFEDQRELFANHELTWGAGFRLDADDNAGSTELTFTGLDTTRHTYEAFVQDRFPFLIDGLQLILGTKLEYNTFTDFEIQPSAKALFRRGQWQTYWFSVQRAVRTPSRSERVLQSFVAPPAPPLPPTALLGNPLAAEEELLAFEVGGRVRPSETVSVDLALFFNRYDRVFGNAPVPGGVQFVNLGETDHLGLEMAVDWQILEQLQVRSSYSLLEVSSSFPNAVVPGGDPPQSRQRASILAIWDVLPNWRASGMLRYVDEFVATSTSPPVDAYLELDLRVQFRAGEHLLLAVGGRNLLDESHQEFPGQPRRPATEVRRSVFAEAAITF